MKVGAGWGCLLAVCVWCGWVEPAAAQVERHDFRLFMDASLFAWQRQASDISGLPGGVAQGPVDTKAYGPFTAGGLGLGFAAHPMLLPQLYFSMQGSADSSFVGKARQWDLQPGLEIALAPSLPVVPYVLVGAALSKKVVELSGMEGDLQSLGMGPVLALGLHGFVIPRGSLDVSLLFRSTFVFDSTAEDTLGSAGYDVTMRRYALLLNVGASFWLGSAPR